MFPGAGLYFLLGGMLQSLSGQEDILQRRYRRASGYVYATKQLGAVNWVCPLRHFVNDEKHRYRSIPTPRLRDLTAQAAGEPLTSFSTRSETRELQAKSVEARPFPLRGLAISNHSSHSSGAEPGEPWLEVSKLLQAFLLNASRSQLAANTWTLRRSRLLRLLPASYCQDMSFQQSGARGET